MAGTAFLRTWDFRPLARAFWCVDCTLDPEERVLSLGTRLLLTIVVEKRKEIISFCLLLSLIWIIIADQSLVDPATQREW